MKKERFLFYVDWRNQMEMMNDEQLRRFMYNLCNYHEEKDVELPTELERALWLGIQPVLKLNNKKYEARAEKSRENGKLGGAPLGNQNARKDDSVQNNLNQPKQPDKRKEISEKSKEINDKGEEINDKSEMKKDNWQEKTGNTELLIDNSEMSIFSNTSMYSGETFTNIENYSEDKKVKSVSSSDTGAKGKKTENLELINFDKTSNNICKDIPWEFYEVSIKIQKSGWSSLSTKETAIFNKWVGTHNKYIRSIGPENELIESTISKITTLGNYKKYN